MTESATRPTLQTTIRRLHVIANPVSGVNRQAVNIIRSTLQQHPYLEWELTLTEKAGDATRSARDAAGAGVDLVLACGGDGTVMEVACGLENTGVPMAIIPMGTANVMAVELGIPLALEQALALALDENHGVRQVDAASVDETRFMLRVGIGYEADVSAGTSRSEKSKFGRWAYFRTAWRKLKNLRPSRYILTLDGQKVVTRGVTCLICNSTNIGIPNLRLVNQSSVSDGLLDVVVIHSMRLPALMRAVVSVAQSVLPMLKSTAPAVETWQARQVTVETSRRQRVAYDGEPLKRAKRVTAKIIPNAARIVVPHHTLTT